MKLLTILIVDDEELQRETLASILRDRKYLVYVAQDVNSSVEILQKHQIDILLADFKIPGGTGLDVAKRAMELSPGLVALLMTAYADVNGVIEAMRAGVLDYLLKPLNVEALLLRLSLIAERRELREEVGFLRAQINRSTASWHLLGQSKAISEVRELIDQVAQSRCTVLLTGESGTGKEVAAREIHFRSGQAHKRFVAINCGALPENLLESELFGHKKGAFTGAVSDKPGLFLMAHEGTLFLDEIGELPRSLQVKLLRALQEREIVPVGGTQPIKVDLRIIAATNQDLNLEMKKGSFRQDLFFRINVVGINIPPLRDRREDIPGFAQHFIEHYSLKMRKPVERMTHAACCALMTYHWPGNVRELENVIERAVILSQGRTVIDLNDLPECFRDHGKFFQPEQGLNLDGAIRRFSRQYILSALQLLGVDKREVARALGVSLSGLYRKMEELDISVKSTDTQV